MIKKIESSAYILKDPKAAQLHKTVCTSRLSQISETAKLQSTAPRGEEETVLRREQRRDVFSNGLCWGVSGEKGDLLENSGVHRVSIIFLYASSDPWPPNASLQLVSSDHETALVFRDGLGKTQVCNQFCVGRSSSVYVQIPT